MVGFVGRTAVIMLSAATMIAQTMTAEAAGALTVGTGSDGLVYGWTINYPNEGEAKYQALANCLTADSNGTSIPIARSNCKLITVFNKQCMSLSWDPSSTGWGWALNQDKGAAEKKAIDKCNTMPGAIRSGYCVAARTVCDTTGSGAPEVAAVPSTVVPMSMPASASSEAQAGNGAKAR